MATFADLKAAADTAAVNLRAAQSRLEQARADVILASAAVHQAIIASVTDQPAPPGKTAAPVDPVAVAEKRLADALAAYAQVRRDLGL